MGWIKEMLQNWLEIVPAQGQRVRIEENTTFAQGAKITIPKTASSGTVFQR
ncbi:MAG: hypothetical protein KH354_05260 [Clostridiales bacterium]|nr:hypothetical protein [Clostridiales bacterium]